MKVKVTAERSVATIFDVAPVMSSVTVEIPLEIILNPSVAADRTEARASLLATAARLMKTSQLSREQRAIYDALNPSIWETGSSEMKTWPEALLISAERAGEPGIKSMPLEEWKARMGVRVPQDVMAKSKDENIADVLDWICSAQNNRQQSANIKKWTMKEQPDG